MSPTLRKKIEQKIVKIDRLDKELHELRDFLWQIVYVAPKQQDLTESELLRIIGEGEREYKEGKTKVLNSLKDLR